MMVWVEEVAKTTIFGDGITAEDMVRNSFKKFIARSSKTMISSLSVYAQEMLFSDCPSLCKLDELRHLHSLFVPARD